MQYLKIFIVLLVISFNLQVLADTQNPEAKSLYEQSVKALDVGDIENALNLIQKSLQLDPQYPEAHDQYGYVLLKKGKANEAVNEFQISLKLKPNLRTAKIGLGLAYFKLGFLKEAEAILLDSLKLNPYPANAHYALGLIYQTQGKSKEANVSFKLAFQTYKKGKY